jgi:hypothetical protein
MPNEPTKFNHDVIDVAVQITQLDLGRNLMADTIGSPFLGHLGKPEASVLLDEDHLQIIELRAEAVEAMACLAKLDTLYLVTELRRMRALADELQKAAERHIAAHAEWSRAS